MIDSSGSIRDNNPQDGSFDNWNLILDFVKQVSAYISFYHSKFFVQCNSELWNTNLHSQQIVNMFEIGEDDTRVALLVFSEIVELEFGLYA